MAEQVWDQLHQYAKTLENALLFKGLTRSQIQEALEQEQVRIEAFEAGEMVADYIHAPKCVGIVLCGSLIVDKHAGASVVLMNVLEPGTLFGVALLFHPQTAMTSIKIYAHQTSQVLMIPQSCFLSMLQKNACIAQNYMQYLTDRIVFLNSRIDQFVKPTAEERLLLYLNQQAHDQLIELSYSYTRLAQALGVSRASLYRAIESLERTGQIKRQGKRITLCSKAL